MRKPNPSSGRRSPSGARLLGETHFETATTISNLGNLFYRPRSIHRGHAVFPASDRDLSESALSRALDDLSHRSFIGGCLTKQKRYREAEEQLLAAYAGLKTARGEQQDVTRNASVV